MNIHHIDRAITHESTECIFIPWLAEPDYAVLTPVTRKAFVNQLTGCVDL